MPDLYLTEALASARNYFRQDEPRFWLWADDALCWRDGATIVFHQELAEILRRLAVDGLPSFTPLLLLLAACRENYRRERTERALAQEKALLGGDASGANLTSEDLLAALDRVAALPKELRSTIEAKAALAEIVFAGQRPLPAENVLGAVQLFRSIPAAELLGDGARADDRRPIEDTQIWTKEELLGVPAEARPHVTSALQSMREGLARVDADALRLRLRTGLDQWVQPANIGAPADDSLRGFISRLRQDPELSGLGRLAHDLMAAVHVPRGMSEPEELRLGGVSDIANRGPLDRLLVSELAHDDLTLAVRVAVGEALYLRREAPPRTPVRQRFVLIDCGIRLWGVPRVFAAAVGLALAATADRQTQAATWRATARDVESVDLGSREGLIGLLAQLEATPQPAAALGRFLETVDRSDTAADAILITHDDVLADADFRRAIAAFGERRFYLATVDRDGRFRLLARSGRGIRTVREARFDLDRLLAPASRPTARLIHQDAGSDLPAILSVDPFPLLLPHPITNGRIAFQPAHGALAVTHDGRLMHWRRAGRGATQITAALPPGRLHHLSIDDAGTARVVVGSPPTWPLFVARVDLTDQTCHIAAVDKQVEAPLGVAFFQQRLFLISNDAVWVVSEQGRASAPLKPVGQHFSQRFFSDGKRDWYALSFDGHAPRLTPVPLHRSIDAASIAMMFDRTGFDGPWVVTTTGRVASALDGSEPFAGWPGRMVVPLAVSPGGHHLVLFPMETDGPRTLSRYAKRHLADKLQIVVLPPEAPAATVEVFPWNEKYAFAFDPELRRLVRPARLPHRFQRIGADAEGRLTLLSRRGRAWLIAGGPKQPGLRMVSVPTASLHHTQVFERVDAPPGIRFTLRIARWADGSRAWLDSRGLLHLKSGDRSLPELTLVLVPRGEAAAWASDGRTWGPTLYTGVDAAAPGEELLAAIDAFLARLA